MGEDGRAIHTCRHLGIGGYGHGQEERLDAAFGEFARGYLFDGDERGVQPRVGQCFDDLRFDLGEFGHFVQQLGGALGCR